MQRKMEKRGLDPSEEGQPERKRPALARYFRGIFVNCLLIYEVGFVIFLIILAIEKHVYWFLV